MTSIILSTIVGSAIFMTIAGRLGVPGAGSLPSRSNAEWFFHLFKRFVYLSLLFVLSAFLIAAPVTTGLQTFLKDAEQAARHEASWAVCYHAQQQLDMFLLRYSNVSSTPETREEARTRL